MLSDEERLRGELIDAKRIRDAARGSLSEAQSAVIDARAKLRASAVYKGLKAAKSRKKRADQDLARAGLQLDAVLDEAMTGRTGLALFDGAQPVVRDGRTTGEKAGDDAVYSSRGRSPKVAHAPTTP